jgi:hypothetical protein
MKTVSVMVDEVVWQQMKSQAASDGVLLPGLVDSALRWYLAQRAWMASPLRDRSGEQPASVAEPGKDARSAERPSQE